MYCLITTTLTLQPNDMQTSKPENYTRKDFLRRAGSTAVLAALGINFVNACTSITDSPGEVVDTTDPDSPIVIDGNTIIVDLSHSSNAGLRTQGGWLLISQADVLLVNVDGNFYRAFTSVCTHAGCKTSWNFNGSVFICTCHNSRFNTSGEVVQGPATRDLAEFSVARSGDTLTINK